MFLRNKDSDGRSIVSVPRYVSRRCELLRRIEDDLTSRGGATTATKRVEVDMSDEALHSMVMMQDPALLDDAMLGQVAEVRLSSAGSDVTLECGNSAQAQYSPPA